MKSRVICYILWMMEEMQRFEGNSSRFPLKRARWIAYIQGRMEQMGMVKNKANRIATKLDVAQGHE